MQSNMSAPLQVARRYWGMSLVRGVVAIIFGLLAIFWPHLTFAIFMVVFGIFAIVEGVILLGNAFTQRTIRSPMTSYARRVDPGARANEPYTTPAEAEGREQFAYGARSQAQPEAQPNTTGVVTHKANRSTLMVEGILSIICGILALILPSVIGALALYAVAAWALFKGIGALMQTGTRGWVLGVIGVLGVILFLIVLFRPLAVIHSLLWIVGVFSLIMGIMLVVRALTHKTTPARETRPMEPSY
jgi:uncharacterized membrane protein HdeD (DUF308 family)